VDAFVLEAVERDLAGDGEDTERAELDAAFERFERTQGPLSERFAEVLSRPLDETALALGYFLTIAVWMAFERAFGSRLSEVSADTIEIVEASLAAEEELRAENSDQPVDFEDVVAAEQPSVLAFVHEHIEAALDVTARGEDADEKDVDVDDVHAIYREVVLLTLALSQAVRPVGAPLSSRALLA
jgi:hypothetical protein